MNRKSVLKQLKELRNLGYNKNMRLAAEEWDKPWKTLIATILSARTRDEVTINVCKELFKKYRTIKSLSKANVKNISKIIKPVNFYKNKTKNIIACARKLVNKFKGNVPHDINLLISLSGVGRKTANVFLSEYKHDAIGVDTHVSYISQKLRWVKSSNPYKIEKDLEKLFPRNYWRSLNPILVRFGKTYTSRNKKNEILYDIRKIK